ncbi:hypothetical protein FA13DRAFT_1792719 [Coprinellus micaceus]|uniref:PX domain-containing protein n=1 Tax=Coprinellus micaceus TaxID=71717 RepID=A0A4Y7T8I9_COPMI|nr:hypothetical protein FA13DRAFT_1792719 [Coprinellus micaceus]
MASLIDSALTEEPESQSQESQHEKANELTPLRAHYLKKSLIQLQFSRELDILTTTDVPNVSNLSFLGPPFSTPPKGVQPLDLPFLKFIFRQFVLTFPFMEAAPKGFYAEKVQPFVDALVSRNLAAASLLDDADEAETSRRKLLAKIERNMAMFLGSTTKLVEREDIVRLTQTDLDRLERLAERRKRHLAKNKDAFEVNVVGVRTVVEKGRVRSRAHEEFIIRTRRSRYHDVYVSRRYGDFKTLANELAKRYPEENIRLPPAKDRTTVTAPSSAPANSLNFPSDTFSPISPNSVLSWDGSETQVPPSPSSRKSKKDGLARERNRLTLRAYLTSLLSSRTVGSSPVLKAFLLMDPVTLSPGELDDCRRREEADRTREESRKRFAREIASRVDSLRDAVKSVKGDLMGKDGLTHVFATIKVTPHISGLPDNYKAVVEWARISLASTAFHTFVASDDASETFAGLKRIHGLMPYFMLKGALKITNPIAMIRAVLDLFLAQPFGGRSLLQRMFTSSLTEEVRSIEEEIEAVKDKVDDPVMCDKIRQFVYAPREIQEMFKMDAVAEKMNIITVVLRSSEAPALSRPQMHRLAKAHKAHQEYTQVRSNLEDSDDDEGPQNEDAWLIEDLKILTHMYQKLRDREQLIALIFEGFTSELLKDIITIFYSPLAKVYRAASIADSLGDLQDFISDLIRTVESVEEISGEDPSRTVQAFINLVQRHEQSFYQFVHNVHSKGEGLFESLMRWIELFLTFMREGLGPPISLEFLLPHSGKEREDILAEVDKVAVHHYKLKVLYEDKIRRRFGRAQADQDADAEDAAAREMVNGVLGEINFGDIVQGDAVDLAAADTDEEDTSDSYDSDEDSSEYTSSSELADSESEREESATLHPPPQDLKQVQPHRKASNSTTSFSVAEGKPVQKSVSRKRSMSLSLKGKRSLTFSMNGISISKDSKKSNPPPVPPLPASAKAVNGRGGSGANSPVPTPSPSAGRPAAPLRSLSSSTVRPGSESSSVYTSASSRAGSTTSLQRQDPNFRPPSVASRSSAANTPASSRPSSRTPSRAATIDSSSPATGSTSHRHPPIPGRAPPPTPKADSVPNPPAPAKSSPHKNSKAKNHGAAAVEPPALTEIPKLLPVFVEMMRPSLRPRKRTAAPSAS